MVKRGLSDSEGQTKSAKKKKTEGATKARDAAPGSRVYTVEYQVDTTIEHFDEDFMNGQYGVAMLEEDYAEANE